MYVHITKTGKNNGIIKNGTNGRGKVTLENGERGAVEKHISLFHYATVVYHSAAKQSLHNVILPHENYSFD